MGMAIDMNGQTIQFYLNGVANGSAVDFSSTFTDAAYPLAVAVALYDPDELEINFGNPSYANSSDAADANGYGKFEYAPPTGFYALCTKNLAEFG